MSKHPFLQVAVAWEVGLVSGLTSDFRVFDANHYVGGDLSISSEADDDIVGPEFAVQLNVSQQPVALEIALVHLIGPDFDTKYFGSVFVVPNMKREVIELASPLQIALAADAVDSLRTDDALSVFVRARKVAENRGAELVLDKNRRGESTVRIERQLSSTELEYKVSGSDQSSFRYPNRQLQDFVRTVQEVISALRPIGPAPKPAGSCYIATAVYGSYDAPEVVSLRRFRDERLASSSPGRAFIRWYYAVSPKLANQFSGTSPLNRIARVLLDNVVRTIEKRRPLGEGLWDRHDVH